MRIVGGVAGGVPLRVPRGKAVRPTSDRTKEALFASLGDIRGWTVVDVFAGSGALGLEALSRGANSVTFVEFSADAVQSIRQNLTTVQRAFGEQQIGSTRILQADAAMLPHLLASLAGKVHLILADPPYRPGPLEFGAEKFLRDEAITRWAAGSLLVLEHAARTSLPWAPQTPWQLIRTKRYGTQSLSFAGLA